MSHFTKVKTRLRDLSTLKEALHELGYHFEENEWVGGYGGQKTQVDLVIRRPNGYDIGFKRAGEELEMVADLWGLSVKQEDFLNQVSQKYAYHTIKNETRKQGFTISSEETQEDGAIRVVVQRWR